MTNAVGYTNPLYYRHSGQFSATGLIVATLASLIASIVLGAAYAYIDLYNPCISIITFVATAGFGYAVGFVSGYVLRWGQVRNVTITTAIAVVSAFVALYSSWIFWVYALLQKSLPGPLPFTAGDLALHPPRLWRLIQLINETGVWSIGGHVGSSSGSAEPVKGVFLWIVWAIEAGGVVWLSIFATVTMGTTLPFCETCLRWCPVGKRLFSTPPGNPAALKDRLEAKDFAPLIALGPGQPLGNNWFEVYLHSCPQCQSLHALTVNAVSMKLDKKGKQRRTEKPLVDKLLLSSKELQSLQTLKQHYDARKAAPAVQSAPSDAAKNEVDPSDVTPDQ